MLGIVDDDIAGSTDIGLLFAKWNYRTEIHAYEAIGSIKTASDILIINTNSRLDPGDIAYSKTKNAMKYLKELGCTQYFKNTDSIFRGNIGAKLDAMQDGVEIYFSVIVLCDSDHGEKDVSHTLRQDGMVRILQTQTHRKVGVLDNLAIRQGAKVLKNAIEEMKKEFNYVVLDDFSTDCLGIILEAVKDYPLLCGSKEVGSLLPTYWPLKQQQDYLQGVDLNQNTGVFIPNGSLMPKMKQHIDFIIDKGVIGLILNTESIFTDEGYQEEIARACRESKTYLSQGKSVVLSTPYSSERIKATRDRGRKFKGFDGIKSSEYVAKAMADVTFRIVQELQIKKLIIGGGDTSHEICKQLGINGVLILDEIAQGICSCITLTENPMVIIVKSSEYGQTDFLQRSLEYMEQIDLDIEKALTSELQVLRKIL